MSADRKLTDWVKGPPPAVGWWNASRCRDPEVRRWWNGSYWSAAVYVGMTTDGTMERVKAVRTTTNVRQIEWRGLAEPPQ
jgi:hypothetical protein